MKNMLTDSAQYEFQLDNQFFMDLDAPEVQKGHVNVTLDVRKTSGIYQLDFHLNGIAIVTCDRCLDEMEQPIETDERLKVKLGPDFSEIDDIVVVPEEDGNEEESHEETETHEIDPRWNELKKILDNN